ncbi:hypothetical protein CVT25_003012 [Psilocybe cyanescens]|uniref:Mei2-like C-terminal RNA recognition motif domain-containing protein n=1 Tax=Psilocybe cyanescens TaxID=93625 RepID=A0A409WN73_PSICY|nr:hypothetical protein CVT25_003012 [Psilocybe cyanescens]
MSKTEKSFSHRPSAPPSPRVKPVDDTVDKGVRPRHVKYASLGPAHREHSTTNLKTHARRRTERDQPHSLLTPPLTPSSSIRTTTSDSITTDAKHVPDSEDTDSNEEISDPEQQSTRILLLGNVNRQISVGELKAAIVDVLLAVIAEERVNDDIVKTGAAHPFPPDDFVKGINERHLASKGIIPVVFFDVRVAKLAQELLTVKNFDRLRACIGEETDDEGERLGLSGRLVALEELTETLGYSPFLDSIDGQFTLAVQRVKNNHTTQEDVSPTSEENIKSESTAVFHSREGFNFLTIQNVLKSIGSVRVFKFLRRLEDKDGVISLFYNVEYHDSRVAPIACKDLANQTMFGMKFSTLSKVGSPPSFPRSSAISSTIPFPNTLTAGESFGGLAFGTAGFKSNIRQRFNFPVSNETPSRECDIQELTYQKSNPIPGVEPSPRFFYNTHAPSHAVYNQEALNAVGHPMGPTNHVPIIPPQNGFRMQVCNAWDNDVIYRSDSISPCYNPDGACWYCPSTRGTANSQNYSPYSIPSSTPSPGYYPSITSTPMPGMVNAPLSPHPPFFAYEYMDPQLQAVPGAAPWGVDPAIAAVGPGPNTFMPMVAMNVPSPAPYYMPEETILPTPRPYPRMSVRHTPDLALHQPHVERENGPSVSPPPFAHISTPESDSPASYRSSSVVRYEPQTSTGANPGSSERNQLNLVKIEDGVDTRTTVMIKNIPNKMSDTDLTAYIGKVCPRRIDFLYLRMDFKNGCNVGYAFVNFIAVEDLLHFAKERLGAKWNMFSSEKVLQMSYANYQGKEALIEKFKNSAIMDEREAWRPRIFHSFGKDQGLPEPFPAPTHIRRKERSSFNRGTLFPPGANAHNSHHIHGLFNNTHRRYADDNRTIQHRTGDHFPAYLRRGRSPDSSGSRQGDPVDKARAFRNSTSRGTG